MEKELQKGLNNNVTFGAPWSLSVKLVTVLMIILFSGIGLFGIFAGLYIKTLWFLWFVGMVIQPFAVLIITFFFMIRGYVITQNTLLIKRLFWYTKLDLTCLMSVEVDPEAMSGSKRTFGNGGFFSITGMYWNKKNGSYRAFATNPKLSVILKFLNHTILISPEKPEASRPNGARPKSPDWAS